MAVLDHVVINALHDTDAAEALFAALGFALTPRGYHSLGSVNHLMVTPGAYLEIAGVPSQGRQRQEVLDSPLGLSGIVVQTQDADATYRRLLEAGLAPLEPMALSRPVTIDGVAHQAAFRNVRLPHVFGGGRVYFCQHLTPELVWRPEWLEHPNGFAAIELLELESPDPGGTAERFARAVEGELLPGAAPARVRLEDSEIHVHEGPADRMRAVGLVFGDIAALEARAGEAGAMVSRPAEGRITLGLPGLDTVLVCRGGA